MSDFVLVHGAWGGGWAYDRLASELKANGHRVLVAQLTGLGSRKNELHPAIDLSAHIADVVAQIKTAGLDRFVLAGHSYGGMVITGIAAQLGARIDALIYIDAFLPTDGQSLWDITGEFEHNHYIDSQKYTPGLVAPIMGAGRPDLTRQPLLTLIEAVRFSGEEAKPLRRIYIFAKSWELTPFRRFATAIQHDCNWEYHETDSGHDVMTDQPQQLLAIMLDCAA